MAVAVYNVLAIKFFMWISLVSFAFQDLINHFWSYHPGKRHDFKLVSKILEKIPVMKGRLYRSPSQPVTHMLRAVEADF